MLKAQSPHWIHIQDFEFDAALQSGESDLVKEHLPAVI
jgi:hypothetical protein